MKVSHLRKSTAWQNEVMPRSSTRCNCAHHLKQPQRCCRQKWLRRRFCRFRSVPLVDGWPCFLVPGAGRFYVVFGRVCSRIVLAFLRLVDGEPSGPLSLCCPAFQPLRDVLDNPLRPSAVRAAWRLASDGRWAARPTTAASTSCHTGKMTFRSSASSPPQASSRRGHFFQKNLGLRITIPKRQLTKP